jgi:hypothetical protein
MVVAWGFGMSEFSLGLEIWLGSERWMSQRFGLAGEIWLADRFGWP